MSVVNKMLQDLEARKAESDSSADYQPPAPSKSTRAWIYTSLVILILAISVWIYFNGQHAETSPGITPPIANDNSAAQTTLNETQADPVDAVQNPEVTAEQAQTLSQAPQLEQPELTPEQLQAYSFNQNSPAAQQASMTQLADLSTRKNSETPEADLSELDVQSQVSQGDTDSPIALSEIVANQVKPVLVKSRSSELPSTTPSMPAEQSNAFQVRSSQSVDTVDGLKQQVQIALKRGDENEAIALLSKLLDKAPDSTSARKRLAAMLFAQEKHLQADEVLQNGVQLQPDSHDLRLMQARLWVQMKNPAKAHDLLREYQVSAAQVPDYVSYRASLAQQLSRFELARSDYAQLTQSQPANARWWLGLAVAEERLGNTHAALQAYQNAKGLDQLAIEVNEFVEQRIHYLAGVK